MHESVAVRIQFRRKAAQPPRTKLESAFGKKVREVRICPNYRATGVALSTSYQPPGAWRSRRFPKVSRVVRIAAGRTRKATKFWACSETVDDGNAVALLAARTVFRFWLFRNTDRNQT